uniref:Uncharacterized protein n=1 Tax=Arundo donax TaxID=35708 RepID=A0A0A9ARU4_ARUDO
MLCRASLSAVQHLFSVASHTNILQ